MRMRVKGSMGDQFGMVKFVRRRKCLDFCVAEDCLWQCLKNIGSVVSRNVNVECVRVLLF